jgi:uncharacterized protein
MITVLDLRVYPLFAFLFGYGMMQLFLRQTAAGTSEREGVALLRRRSLWLIAFGFVHAALLMAGDILGAYGLASLWLGWLFLRRAQRTLLVWSAVAAVLVAWTMVPAVVGGDLGLLGQAPTEPHHHGLRLRPGERAGRRRHPARYLAVRGPWRHVVVWRSCGDAARLLGGAAPGPGRATQPSPHAAVDGGRGAGDRLAGRAPGGARPHRPAGGPPAAVSEQGALRLIADGTGLAAGLGYVALFGLIAHRMGERRRHRAVAAVGRRSLSCYLAHSLIFAPCWPHGGWDWGRCWAAPRWPRSPSASGWRPWSEPTPWSAPDGAVPPKCCCAG